MNKCICKCKIEDIPEINRLEPGRIERIKYNEIHTYEKKPKFLSKLLSWIKGKN